MRLLPLVELTSARIARTRAPSEPLQSRHCPVGQAPCPAHLRSSSSFASTSLALLRSIVGEKRIFLFPFQYPAISGPPGPLTCTFIPAPWVSYLSKRAHVENVQHKPQKKHLTQRTWRWNAIQMKVQNARCGTGSPQDRRRAACTDGAFAAEGSVCHEKRPVRVCHEKRPVRVCHSCERLHSRASRSLGCSRKAHLGLCRRQGCVQVSERLTAGA